MQRPGFTLLEIVVVASAFSIIFLISTTVYSNAIRNQRIVQTTQRVGSDGRYLIETLARAVRTKFLNYDFYDANGSSTGIDSGDQNVLAVIDRDGSSTCFVLYAGKIQSTKAATCTGPSSIDDPADFDDITPTDLTIVDFKVYAFPATNPYGQVSAGRPDVQPHVTLYLHSRVSEGGRTADSKIQTTVTSRQMLR